MGIYLVNQQFALRNLSPDNNLPSPYVTEIYIFAAKLYCDYLKNWKMTDYNKVKQYISNYLDDLLEKYGILMGAGN